MLKEDMMTFESKIKTDLKIPVVSIGMPIYNGEKYVEKSLDDLLGQTFKDYEIIISDNGSTDRTEEICKRYESKDPRIRYYRQPQNNGSSANFYFVFNQARGEYFMWAAMDDRWDKDYITILVEALKLDESYVSAFSPFQYVDENKQPINHIQYNDYSGSNVLTRVLKFTYSYNDAFIYGIFRLKHIKDFKFPIWWWINSKDHTNCVYPVLIYFLSKGGYMFVGQKALWFNTIHFHDKPKHDFIIDKHYLINYVAFLLRKINVSYESIRSIYKGSNSIFVTVLVGPIILIKCIIDCFEHTIALVLSMSKNIVSKQKIEKQNL